MNERPSLTRCLAIAGGAVVVAGVFVVGMVLGITLFVSEADEANPAPSTGDSPLAIVAIGDGYMSGEGAGAFFPGTDRPGQNECRRTSTSYPYLVARLMEPPDPYDGVALVSAACSGAGTANVIPFEDLPCTEDVFPDGCARPQFEYAADGRYAPAFQIDALTADTGVVLISIGANDAQLTDVIAACTEYKESCLAAAEPWAVALGATLRWRIESVFTTVRARAPEARVLTLTYPVPLFRSACGRARLDQAETDFFIDSLIPQINSQIAAAAAGAGTELVDLADVFAGHRLCQPDRPDGESPEIAVNSFQIQPVRGITWTLSSWFHGSFFPNEYGHQLIADRLIDHLEQRPSRPTASSSQTPSFEAPSFSAAPVSTAPASTDPYESDSECSAVEVDTRTIARPPGSSLPLAAVDAGSTVCFRAIGGSWGTATAPPNGELRIPLAAQNRRGFTAWNEVLYETSGSWKRLVVVATSEPGSVSLPFARAWTWGWVIRVAGIVFHPLIFTTMLVLVIGGWMMWCMRRIRPDA